MNKRIARKISNSTGVRPGLNYTPRQEREAGRIVERIWNWRAAEAGRLLIGPTRYVRRPRQHLRGTP